MPEGDTTTACGGSMHLPPWDEALARCKYVSFDVFDTLLGRNTLDPHDVHIEVGQRLKATGIRSGPFYKRNRIRAERVAGQEKRSPANLEEIHRRLAAAMRWSEKHAAVAQQIELTVEREFSIPLESGLSILNKARKQKKILGFISDMYLPSWVIRELLQKSNAWQEGDVLWVSCELGASKSDGSLFKAVAEKAGLAFSDWLHVGDNPKGDGRVPQSLGIRTILLPPPSIPARIKRKLPGPLLKRRSFMESSLCGAIERAIRNKPHNLDARHTAIWDATCTGVAPSICNFTLWALNRASALGLKDLWCFARDGQTVHRAAQVMLPRLDLDITTRYMPASRQAFRLAGLRDVGDFELSWIFGAYGELPPDVVVERLGGGEEIGRAVAAALESAGLTFDVGLGANGVQVLREWALSPEGARLIEISAAQQRKLFLQYLDQEDVTKPFGVLDIGWAGSLQDGLRKMLAGSPYRQDVLHGFYFGLLRGTNKRPDSALHGYLFEPEGVSKLHRKAIQVFEMFFAADHPQVQGFHETQDGLVEVKYLPSESWQFPLDWGVKIQQQAILSLARELRKTDLVRTQHAWMESARMLLDDFLLKPSISEAKAYATWVVSSLVGIETNECLGPALDTNKLSYYMKNLSLTSHHWQPIMKRVNNPMIYLCYRAERLLRAGMHKLIK